MMATRTRTNATATIKICPENPETNLEKRIDSLTVSALPYYNSIFKHLAKSNAKYARIVCDFITAVYNEQNVKLGTRRAHTKIICSFIKYLKYKDFQQITKTDILFYLNSLRKPNQQTQLTSGLAHITRDAVLSKFFRWLYEQNEANHNRVSSYDKPDYLFG
jgi:hypothetical protein